MGSARVNKTGLPLGRYLIVGEMTGAKILSIFEEQAGNTVLGKEIQGTTSFPLKIPPSVGDL